MRNNKLKFSSTNENLMIMIIAIIFHKYYYIIYIQIE